LPRLSASIILMGKEITMGRMERIVAEVPEQMARDLRSVVEAGDFPSADDAVAEALGHWLLARQAGRLSAEDLRRHVEAGLEGAGIDGDGLFDRLDAKYAAMIDPGPARG
jgi:Arc/MetJ-type ribon-helix-helix transcriptional regulator